MGMERRGNLWDAIRRAAEAKVPPTRIVDAVPSDDLVRMVDTEPTLFGMSGGSLTTYKLLDRYGGSKRELEIVQTPESTRVDMTLTLRIGVQDIDVIKLYFTQSGLAFVGIGVTPPETPIDEVLTLPEDERLNKLMDRPFEENLRYAAHFFQFRGERAFTSEPLTQLSDEPEFFLHGLSPEESRIKNHKFLIENSFTYELESMPVEEQESILSAVSRLIVGEIPDVFETDSSRELFSEWLRLYTLETFFSLSEIDGLPDVDRNDLLEVALELAVSRVLLTNIVASEGINNYYFYFSKKRNSNGFVAGMGPHDENELGAINNVIDNNVEFGKVYPYEDHTFAIKPLDPEQTRYRVHIRKNGEAQEIQVELPANGQNQDVLNLLKDPKSSSWEKVPERIPTRVLFV